MKVLSVDPGAVSASWAVMPDEGTPFVGDVPVVDKMIDASAFAGMVSAWEPDYVVIEKVNAFPGQGVSSSFRFGQGFGMLLGVFGALRVPVQLVAPNRWKKFYRLGSDKEASRALAKRLYPLVHGLDRVKDHGRAEALLLARFAKGEGVA